MPDGILRQLVQSSRVFLLLLQLHINCVDIGSFDS